MSITVHRLENPSEDDMKRAAHVLHEAFQRRYFLFSLGDESLVEPFLLAHVRATAIGGQLYVAVLPDVGIVGVGLWFGPDQKFLSSQDQRDAGWNQTMEALEEKYQRWWTNFLQEVDDVTDKLYGFGQQLASYHLQTVGVLPEYQQRGYGAALMTAVEHRAAEESKDVVLETLGESAVPVYKQMGFKVLGPVPMNTGSRTSNAYGFRKRFHKMAEDL
ncbi:hypothetical protein CPB84DRAFT_1754256 [Gymnopilus junonius]|uniref:N-acetyltransferase domain-containing protein n=1 Tax=Gymnopilus junonius TaxID=109634 RepID=A0A9P5TEP6_GYMJU|nr:hypothetical protein CPB84DRAFT_1754256 [Gymnopilus junonius]